MYAYIENGQIVRAMIELPAELVGQPVSVQEAAGYYLIAGSTRPTDDPVAGHYWEANVTMVGGRPEVTWTQRATLTDERARAVVAVNTAIALDLARYMTDVTEIKTFLSDPDIQRVLDQPNQTALATADLNRALKALVRQARRQANAWIRTSKVVVGEAHPEALIAEI